MAAMAAAAKVAVVTVALEVVAKEMGVRAAAVATSRVDQRAAKVAMADSVADVVRYFGRLRDRSYSTRYPPWAGRS